MVNVATTETDCGHEVELLGAWPVRGDGAPSIIERKDEDFISALLEELAGTEPDATVPTHRPSSSGDALNLFQPVHRVFNLALLEAHCTTFGTPRLDPRKIDSSGLVVRRVRTQPNGTKRYDAWCATKSRVTGWVELPNFDSDDHRRDPDPARRPQTRYTADPAFDRRQFGSGDRTAEETTSLFVAPPETVATTTRTLLYGMIPVTSSSRAGAMPKAALPSNWAAQWAAHLSLLLRANTSAVSLWPADTAAERAEKLLRNDVKENPILFDDESINPGASRFVLLVRQLAQEFSLLRPLNATTGAKLLEKLNALTITLVDGTTRPAGTYLNDAAKLYLAQPEPSITLPRPKTWPAVSPEQASALYNVLQEIAGETELSVFAGENAGGRYDDVTAHYVIRAFIRVKRPCDCPPEIVWSPYSEEFTIAPWYASGPSGPVPVILPDLTPDFFKNARPNVAFSVPAKLANFLNQDPKKILKGEGTNGSAFTLDWICGFNIPIITICAFILLNVILSLLNIIFFWLPFVKICIPFPRKK